MGREDEGSDLWEWECLRGLFLLLRRGRYSGSSPKVLRTVLLLSFPPNQSLRSSSHKGFSSLEAICFPPKDPPKGD